jgi:hypothetical protein
MAASHSELKVREREVTTVWYNSIPYILASFDPKDEEATLESNCEV